MRSPSDRTFGSNIISPYAPKWARDLAKTERRSLMRKVYDRDLPPIDIAPANDELNIEQIFQQAVASAVPLDPPEPRPIEPRPTKPVSPRQDTEQAFLQVEHTLRKLTQLAADNEPPQPEQNLFINDFRVPRSLDPHTMSEPWSEPWPAQRRAPGRRSMFGLLGRLTIAICAAAIIAFFSVGPFPATLFISNDKPSTHKTVSEPRIADRIANSSEAMQPPAPVLVVNKTALIADANEDIALDLSVTGSVEDAAVVISGLPAGSALSAGRALGTNSWRIPVSDLDHLMLRAPRGFTGTIDVGIELRLADNVAVQRRSLPLTWRETTPPKSMSDPNTVTVSSNPAATAPTKEATPPAIRPLARDDIAALVERGEEFLAAGDIAAARLALQRAAEAGDAGAALALGATYDPIMLARSGPRGISSDITMARQWYEHAKQLGATDASRRLSALANRDR